MSTALFCRTFYKAHPYTPRTMKMMEQSQQVENSIKRYETAIHELERRMPIEADKINRFRVLTVAQRIKAHKARIEKVRNYLK